MEATDIVGGRCKSWNIGQNDIKVDVGASWIHGAKKNPITKLAFDNNVELFAGGSSQLVPLFDYSGKVIPWQLDQLIEKRFNAALNFAACLGEYESTLVYYAEKYGKMLNIPLSSNVYFKTVQPFTLNSSLYSFDFFFLL